MAFGDRRVPARRGRVRSCAAAFVALTLVSLAGCGSGQASPTFGASPAGSVPAAPVPASAPPSATRSGAPSGTSSGEPSAGATSPQEAVFDELMAAIGNPDTGSSSEAMTAFEAAIASGDAAAIESTSEVILGHLAKGRATIASIVASGCGGFCAEWDEMFGHVADAVVAMRDGGVAGSAARVEAGRTTIQDGLLDHFWQGIKSDDPSAYVMTMPDGRVANASRARLSTSADKAFDGDEESAWTAGDASAPQWIELDLGAATTISAVRLLTFQEVAGRTDHRLAVCGVDGRERELLRFTGETADRQWLGHGVTTPVPDVRVIRVSTLETPSTIGWREIQVALASGPASSPSATQLQRPKCGVVNLAAGATVTGEPSAAGSEPALAVDGEPKTGWDAGSRGVLRIALADASVVSEIRVLLGAGGPTELTILGLLPANQRMSLGTMSGPTEAGAWQTVTPPTTGAYRDLEIHVRSGSSTAEVLEIEIIGAALR